MTSIEKRHEECRKRFLSIITEMLSNYSWSEELLELANEAAEFKKGYYYILFPDGTEQIVESYEKRQNEQMLNKLSNEKIPMKIREKIAKALEIRIMDIAPKASLLNHNSYFLIPTNIGAGLKYAALTCDLIWKFAGDKSTDFNYYTKRGLLLPVYLAAQAHYLGDNSVDHIQTKEFIKSSLDNIIKIASLKNLIKLPTMEDIPIFRMFL